MVSDNGLKRETRGQRGPEIGSIENGQGVPLTMYRTSPSTRILKGAESALFREVLGTLFDETSDTIQVDNLNEG